MKMSYPQRSSLIKLSNRNKNNKPWIIFLSVFVLLIIIFSFNGPRSVLFSAGSPLWKLSNGIKNFFNANSEIFRSKTSLIQENTLLKDEIKKNKTQLLLKDVLVAENEDLKSLFGRKDVNLKTVFTAVLVKPPFSPYDTLIIDAGSNDDIEVGDKVIASGNTYIGYVSEVYSNFSKIILYSSPDEKVLVFVGNNDVEKEAIGIGGGNFRLEVPREMDVKEGESITIPSISPNIFGIVEKIEYKEADSFQTILFKSPVNTGELKWVEVVLSNKKK